MCKYSHLYLPPKEYCSCDPIPDEWMDAMPKRSKDLDELKNAIRRKQARGIERLGFGDLMKEFNNPNGKLNLKLGRLGHWFQ